MKTCEFDCINRNDAWMSIFFLQKEQNQQITNTMSCDPNLIMTMNATKHKISQTVYLRTISVVKNTRLLLKGVI